MCVYGQYLCIVMGVDYFGGKYIGIYVIVDVFDFICGYYNVLFCVVDQNIQIGFVFGNYFGSFVVMFGVVGVF